MCFLSTPIMFDLFVYVRLSFFSHVESQLALLVHVPPPTFPSMPSQILVGLELSVPVTAVTAFNRTGSVIVVEGIKGIKGFQNG